MSQINTIPPQTTTYSERTQISLSPSLRRIIDANRLLTDESLSEYIRNAINLRISKEEQSERCRRQAAQVFVGSVKKSQHPEWQTKKRVLVWQRKLRKEKA